MRILSTHKAYRIPWFPNDNHVLSDPAFPSTTVGLFNWITNFSVHSMHLFCMKNLSFNASFCTKKTLLHQCSYGPYPWFLPCEQPAPSAKGKPSKLHKRKHQIGSLYFDMKSKEMELAERRSKGILTKAETQAKYGWWACNSFSMCRNWNVCEFLLQILL